MMVRSSRVFLRRILVAAALLAAVSAQAQSERYEELKLRAADYYSEKSYKLAHETWQKAAELGVPEADRRTLDFYLADSLWRSRPGGEGLKAARENLQNLAGDSEADTLSAEAWESLGDSWLAIEGNWQRAWQDYEHALAAWAASTNIDVARPRYLGVVWKATGPPGDDYRVQQVPGDVLANALRIAVRDENKARAHYFLGVKELQSGDIYSRQRAGKELKAAVGLGNKTAVYENALFKLGEWQAQNGRAEWSPDGSLRLEPDFDAALATFRRFVREFPEGSSNLWAAAKRRIDEITEPQLRLTAGGQFLPGDRPVVRLEWRNVADVRLSVSRVNPATDFQPGAKTAPADWPSAIKLGEPLREWKESGVDDRTPQSRTIEFPEVTEAGVYVVEARGRGLQARAVVVVTDVAALLQTMGEEAVWLACDARTGNRIDGDVRGVFWRMSRNGDGTSKWERIEGTASEGDLNRFALPAMGPSSDLLGFVDAGGRPAIVEGDVWRSANEPRWRVQVFTARAAYRPGEGVEWKLIARTVAKDGFQTPAGELLDFRIVDPGGTVVDEGQVKLTEFGGAWGRLDADADWPLGEYEIEFRREDAFLGSETLFRLEEYRLPEFKVAVATGAESGVRLGDAFAVDVSAEYYFGGAVADADVEIVVREEPWARPISYEDRSFAPPGETRTVVNKTVRTGPDGRASVQVDTPFAARSDLRYAIEARVVDSSGREVVGNAELVVGRQSYFVELMPSRRVAMPGDTVDAAILARDGNDRKVATKGEVIVERRRWTETWRDPQGREVSGEELAKRRSEGAFPPPAEPGWALVREGYEQEEISRTPVETNPDGTATFSFTPADAGFYAVKWSSPDGEGPPVRAETNVWASTAAGSMIGYRSGGVEIIAEPAAPADGAPIPILITTSTSGRDVLLTVAAAGAFLRGEVVHLDGDSKVIVLDRDERMVPNVRISVAAVHGLDFHADQKVIEVPPLREQLTLQLTSSESEASPGAEATFDLMATDWQGRPVRGEFSVSVTDEAASYIQDDYAGDPVEFFLDDSRSYGPRPSSSLSGLPFYRLVDREAKDGREFAFAELSAPAAEVAFKEMVMVEEAESPAVQVRSNFSSTAFWQPGVVTGQDGRASISFRYPDNLTTWRAVARGTSAGAAFGMAEATTRTSRPLIARLQAPRFLVEGDTAEISGVVNNRTSDSLTVKMNLRADGLEGETKMQTVDAVAGGDVRSGWSLEAPASGVARLTLTAVSGDLNDGMAVDMPVVPNGVEKSVSASGKAVAAETVVELAVPAGRRGGSLVITATPSLAATALDALPYLIQYPYGCVEQTMSRFLPAAVTLSTLQDLGLDRAAIANRMFGGVEPAFLAKTHPAMEGNAGLDELNAVVAQGLARIYDFQHEDGAWGWWKEDDSDPFMTAYVLWGLRLAQKSGVGVKSSVIDRAAAWLRLRLVDAVNEPDSQAWLLHALAMLHEKDAKLSEQERAALGNLWEKRDQLTAYGRALFALAANAYGESDKALTLARNLRDGVTRDDQPGVSAATGVGTPSGNAIPTAHWGSSGLFRAWQDGGVEATAFALQALLAISPEDDLIEPSMNWLVKNRRGAQWSNTRDTAITLLSMNAYLRKTKEITAAADFSIEVNGRRIADVTGANALSGQARFEVDALDDGANRIVIRRTAGEAPIYFSARADFFTREQPIPAAGSEVFAKREYFLYDPKLTLLDGYRFDRIPWKDGSVAAANQRVETVLTIEAKNDLEYLVFEDLKPAGLEAVDVRSGETMMAEGADGEVIPVHCELRDRKVAFFVRRLPQGVWKIRYDLRAETPGKFSALPVLGHAMYAPEIRCNGESRRVEIRR